MSLRRNFLGVILCLIVFVQNGYSQVQHDHSHEHAGDENAQTLFAEQWLKKVLFSQLVNDAVAALKLNQTKSAAYRQFLERGPVLEDRYKFIQSVKEGSIKEADLIEYQQALTQRYIDNYPVYKLDADLQYTRSIELKQKGVTLSPLGAGQTCRNLDFEEGTTIGWEGFSGLACTNPYPCGLYSDLSKHYILNSGYDAIVGGTVLPVVAPGGGTYSLRLGNTAIGGDAARLSQTFLVTAANSSFTLKYAVVLEDPVSGHSDAERPYFKVSMIDANGRTIPCADYQVMAKPPIQDFTRVGFTNYYYRPWTVVAIPLTAYIGQNLTVQIDVSDCSLSGHLGYAYIDGSCLPIQVSSQFNVTCNGDPLTLKGPDGFVAYTWSGPGIVGVATNQSVVVNQPGIYSVEVTSFTGSTCKGIVTYEVLGTPNTNAGSDATICVGNSAQLNATGVSSQVTWTPATGLSSTTIPNPIASPLVTTTYQVTSCGVTDDVTVFVNPGYQLSITRDTVLCRPAPVSLMVTPSVLPATYTYRWSPATGLSSTTIANPIATPTTTQTYTVTVVDANGCTRTATVKVTVLNGTPTKILFFPQAKYCGDPINLSVVGGTNFVWTDMLGNSPIGLSCTTCSNPVASPTVTTKYLVTSQNTAPCPNTDTITISSSVFSLTVSPAASYCGPTTQTLNATVTTPGTYTYSWSPSGNMTGSNTATPTVLINATNTYNVTVTNSVGCFRRMSATHTILNGTPTDILASPNAKYCGDPVQLTAIGGTSFVWTDINGNAPVGLSCTTCSNPLATPSTTTTYIVTAQNTSPCKSKDTIVVESLPLFNLAITNPDTTCGATTSTLVVTPSAPGTYTYAWYPVSGNTNQVTVSASTTTDYRVTVTNAIGCSRIATTKRTVFNPLTPLTVTTSKTDVCAGQTAQLAAQVSAGAINTLREYFDSPTLNPSLWSSVTGGGKSTACGFVSGSAMLFNGNSSRIAKTNAFNTLLGGTINFYLYFPTGASQPCENADNGMNVVLEYSIDGGFSWLLLNTYYEYNYSSFTYINYTLPSVTMTASTMFRWRQLSSVGTGDVWLLDNVELNLNYNRTLTYAWTPAASLSNASLSNPVATVTAPTTYTVNVSDGKCNATSSIAVRTVTLKVGMDTTCTNGQPVQLNAVVTGNVNIGGTCGVNTGGTITGPVQTYNQGLNTLTAGGVGPFRGFYHDYRGQYLYTASELNALGITKGQISTVGFTVATKGSTIPYRSFTIKIGCTNATFLSTNAGWQPTTQVYTNPSYSSVIGLNAFLLTTPYTWDGISNLVIEICYDNSSYTSDDYVYYTLTTANQTLFTFTDGGAGCSMTPSNISTSRPNIHLKVAPMSTQPVYSWSPVTNLSNATIGNPIATNVNNQTYTVSVNTGSCILSETVVVSTDQLPTVTPEEQTVGICQGQSATISVSSAAGSDYLWMPATNLNTTTASTVIATPTQTTAYMVQVVNSFKCATTAMVTVEIQEDFTLTAQSSKAAICIGEQVTLSASGAPNYTWTPTVDITNPTSASTTANPQTTTSYSVTSANDCFSHTVVIPIDVTTDIPAVTISSPTFVCAGASLTLDATNDPNYTYAWTPGLQPIHNPVVTPSTDTDYSVLVTNGACSTTATISIAVLNDFTLSVQADKTALCIGEQAVLTASGAPNYTWTPTADFTDPLSAIATVSPLIPTTYAVTSSNSCFTHTLPILIDVYTMPIVNITADPSICAGVSTTLDATYDANYTYAWSPGSYTIHNPVVAPSTSTDYSVLVTNGACANTTNFSITVVEDFILSLHADKNALCIGEQAVLTASGAPNYTWTPTADFADPLSASVTVSPLIPSTYSVTSSNTCFTHSLPISIDVSTMPVVSITAKSPVCSGEVVMLDATYNVNYTYTWTPGQMNIHNPEVMPNTTTQYSLLVSNGACSKVITKTITVSDPIHVEFTVDYTEGDAPFSPRFTNLSSGITSYVWNLGNGQQSTAFVPTPTYNAGEYKVVLQGYNALGCSAKDSVTLLVIASDFFIPNLITPNGDGFNDSFEITHYHDQKRFDVKIVNRWGALVFEQQNYTHEWEAQGQADGIYYYDILDNKTGKKHHGWVQVLAKK